MFVSLRVVYIYAQLDWWSTGEEYQIIHMELSLTLNMNFQDQGKQLSAEKRGDSFFPSDGCWEEVAHK